MTTPTPNDLSKVITSTTARRIIYSTYVVGLVIVGALQVAFAAVDAGTPEALTVAIAVLAYLGIPVGALAVVNTGTIDPATVKDEILARHARLSTAEQEANIQAAITRTSH